jgi:hypothetical protein
MRANYESMVKFLEFHYTKIFLHSFINYPNAMMKVFNLRLWTFDQLRNAEYRLLYSLCQCAKANLSSGAYLSSNSPPKSL